MTAGPSFGYGRWPSRITADDAMAGAVRRTEVIASTNGAFYLETRPEEGSRVVVVWRGHDGQTYDVTPSTFNVRTRVNEYGGGAYCCGPSARVDTSAGSAALGGNETLARNETSAGNGALFDGHGFVVVNNAVDGHLWAVPVRDGVRGATPLEADCYRITGDDSGGPHVLWAALRVTPDGEFVVGVRERWVGAFAGHDGVLAELAAVSIETGRVSILAAGSDFYSSPRISADGTKIAWITWDRPDMPWDNTVLWRAELTRVGNELDISDPEIVVGEPKRDRWRGEGSSTLDPVWDSAGNLWFVSDIRRSSSGGDGPDRWWNLYRNHVLRPRFEGPFEVGRPHWVFGMCRHAPRADGSVIAGITRDGVDALVELRPGEHEPNVLIDDVTHVESVSVGTAHDEAGSAQHETVWAIVATAVSDPQVVAVHSTPHGGVGAFTPAEPRGVAVAPAVPPTDLLPRAEAAVARPVRFRVRPSPGSTIDTAHGLLLLPSDHTNTIGDRTAAGIATGASAPPLIVTIHGGPTSAAEVRWSVRQQFWTSRGFAVLDVNYRGSSGYGRAYRDALTGQWGVSDVADCIAGAQFVAERGYVDASRMVIRGSSAGGMTVLNALAESDTFKAGTSLYGVTDLQLLQAETHRFESAYLDALVAPWPAGRRVYRERSPLNRLDDISAPVLVFQGAMDRVVPVEQAHALVAGLRNNGVDVEYHEFADEAHGFRSADVARSVMALELDFYLRTLNL